MKDLKDLAANPEEMCECGTPSRIVYATDEDYRICKDCGKPTYVWEKWMKEGLEYIRRMTDKEWETATEMNVFTGTTLANTGNACVQEARYLESKNSLMIQTKQFLSPVEGEGEVDVLYFYVPIKDIIKAVEKSLSLKDEIRVENLVKRAHMKQASVQCALGWESD